MHSGLEIVTFLLARVTKGQTYGSLQGVGLAAAGLMLWIFRGIGAFFIGQESQ